MKKIALILLFWFLISYFSLVSPLYLPSPMDVLSAWRITLISATLATITRALVGFLLGILLAYAIHFIAVFLKIENSLQSQFAGARAVPVVAALPLFVIWFGFGEFGRILIILFTACGFFVAPLHDSYCLIGREWTILQDQLRLSVGAYYWRIVVPSTLSMLLGSFRVTAAVSFTVAVASEYLGAQIGLGRFLDSARITFNVPAIFLALFIASFVGILFDFGIRQIYGKWVHWAGVGGKI